MSLFSLIFKVQNFQKKWKKTAKIITLCVEISTTKTNSTKTDGKKQNNVIDKIV